MHPHTGSYFLPRSRNSFSSNDPLEQMKRSIPGCDGVVRLVIFGALHSIRHNGGRDPAETAPKYDAFYFLLYLLSHFQTRGRHVVEFGTTHLPKPIIGLPITSKKKYAIANHESRTFGNCTQKKRTHGFRLNTYHPDG